MITFNVDPELNPILSALKDVWGDTAMDLSDLGAARQMHNAMSEQRNATATVTEGVESSRRTIANTDTGLEVVIYLHQPIEHCDFARSALLHIHGGGFVTGSAAHAEPQLRELAKRFNCVVVSVDYRLAPEHPFPAALYDCLAALQWLHSAAASLNVDPNKITVLGESAGGGLAAGLSLYVRDHSHIDIAQQILLYPMLDYRNVAAASDGHQDNIIWSRTNNKIGWHAYIGEGVDDIMLAYASPTYAQELHNLPPTYLCVGDIDLFYQENLDYIQRLRDAGGNAQIDVYAGAYHAFQVVMPDASVSQKCLQNLDNVLTQALT